MRAAVLARDFRCFASVAAAPAPSPGEPVDPHLLIIDAGRLGVMMDQSVNALHAVAPTSPAEEVDSPQARHAYVFRTLVDAVLRYNFVSNEACRRHAVDPALCTGPYLPSWLGDPSATGHDDATLRAMVDEASVRLIPFWDELCAKGKEASGDENFCAIE